MRRLTAIAAVAFALAAVLPGAAQAAPPPASHSAAADDWVRHSGTYPMDWICVYVGNQVVTQGTWRTYWCRVAGTGYDLWVRAY